MEPFTRFKLGLGCLCLPIIRINFSPEASFNQAKIYKIFLEPTFIRDIITIPTIPYVNVQKYSSNIYLFEKPSRCLQGDNIPGISSDSKILFYNMNFDDSKSSNGVLEFFQDRINLHQSTPLVSLLIFFSDKLWRRFSFIPRQRDYSKRFIWLLEFCFSIIPVNII